MSYTKRLQVLISPTLQRQLHQASQRAGISQGEWVRRAILNTLCTQLEPHRDPVQALLKLDAPTGDIEQMLSEIDLGRQ